MRGKNVDGGSEFGTKVWMNPGAAHLLFHLLLDLLQVGPQVHVDRVLGAQQSLQHGVS